VFAREASAAGVIDAIRAGMTVAVDTQGRRHGDHTLIELISTMPSSEVTDAHPYWRRLSLALAWIGLCGMLLLRGRTT
jgi:hypothetical protein